MTHKTTRFNLALPEDLAKALHAIAVGQNVTLTQICIDALADFFARGATPALDERYAHRLDRISRAEARLENRLTVLTEMLGAFIQHQLTLSAHLPPFEQETARLGKARYDWLLELVARRVADRRASSTRGEEAPSNSN
jgi:hypothetical protein